MVGLLVIAFFWIVLLAGAVVALKRSVRLLIVMILVLYGAVCGVSLVRSGLRARSLLGDFSVRQEQAQRHMAYALELAPDTVRTKATVLAARRLENRIARAAAAFGPRVWNVVWAYRCIPTFEADILAGNLLKLVEVPPLLVYAEAQYARHMADIHFCADAHAQEYRMAMSRSLEVMDAIMQTYEEGQAEALKLCDEVDLKRHDASDPRSSSYRLHALAHRMAGTQIKMEEMVQVSCGAFYEQLYLKVRRTYLDVKSADLGWMPYSPLFMDYGQLVSQFRGINAVEVRWMGDPPRPVVGSVDAVYRVDCEVSGPWPKGQAEWTDPETGASGPTYYIDAVAARLYVEGVQFSKWPGQPDIRSMGIRANINDRMFAGIPSTDVPEMLFWPKTRKGPQR